MTNNPTPEQMAKDRAMDVDEIDRIMAGLRPSQAEMLSGGPCVWREVSRGQVRRHLRQKGLLDGAGGHTSLGLAVRARLLEQDHG